MPASIGVNLRVTGHCSQGGRKYMEDLFSVAYQQTEDERDLEYAFFGIYDGHGGKEAAAFAKEHLMNSIVKQRQFWSDNDEDVLKAIRNGYMLTHLNMWKELEKWPKTVTGLPSTAGTTASVAFIRRGKIYIGHVGDSAIVLGYQKEDSEEWSAKPLTLDHKPESTAEIERIQRCGGKVISKAGVPRVVWNRPRLGHKGPIKKNTPMDEIPFLAVARSLGDLWSYNLKNDEFIVSPDPDVGVLTIDPAKFRCLIFGTDGLWNMISPEGAVTLVQATERHNEAALVGGNGSQLRDWLNPSKSLVDHALERWSNTRMRADNTSVVTLMLDPPGPPRATVLRSRTTAAKSTPPAPPAVPEVEVKTPVPQNGLTIMTRYSEPERAPVADAALQTLVPATPAAPTQADETEDSDAMTNYGNPAESYFMARLLNRTRVVNTLAAVLEELASEAQEPKVTPQLRESLPATLVPEPTAEPDARPPESPPEPPATPAGDAPEPEPDTPPDDGGIQINEVSSSSPTEAPPKARGRKTRKDAAARPHRVLRSHHEPWPIPQPQPETEPQPQPQSQPQPPRPQTRQATDRQARAKPAPPTDRVVILTRRATPPVPSLGEPGKVERGSSVAKAERAPVAAIKVERVPTVKIERASSEPYARPRRADAEEERTGRATRSQAAPATPLSQKITRSIGAYARELRGAAAAAAAAAVATSARSGNSMRAGRPARRGPRSKENLVAPRARAASAAPTPRPRRADAAARAPEPCGAAPAPAPAPPPARALRSRNDAADAQAAAPPPCKRPRCDDGGAPPGKAPRPGGGGGGERCARAIGKRASGPWAPALALRNRLRRRLAK